MDAAKKRPGLAIVLGGIGKPKKGEAEPDEDVEVDEEAKPDDEGAEHDAMDEFISAVGAGDTGKALEAFRVLKSLCSDEE